VVVPLSEDNPIRNWKANRERGAVFFIGRDRQPSSKIEFPRAVKLVIFHTANAFFHRHYVIQHLLTNLRRYDAGAVEPELDFPLTSRQYQGDAAPVALRTPEAQFPASSTALSHNTFSDASSSSAISTVLPTCASPVVAQEFCEDILDIAGRGRQS